MRLRSSTSYTTPSKELYGDRGNAQQELYGGRGAAAMRRLIDPDIVWHVPGESPIAGCYEGVEEVIAYMLRRRDLAGGTFRMRRRELLVGEA